MVATYILGVQLLHSLTAAIKTGISHYDLELLKIPISYINLQDLKLG